MEGLFIHEDITDWRDEVFRDELIIMEEKDILDALGQGSHTAKVARAAIVSREIGKAPANIVRPNKTLLTIGAMQDVTQIAHKVKAEVTAADGAVYDAPAFIGRGNIEELIEAPEDDEPEEGKDEIDLGPSFVGIHDPMARQRAERHLFRVVPGHIWNRLLIVHEGGGDVALVALELKDKIDEMVRRITEPSTA